jgi:hypothetical protein
MIKKMSSKKTKSKKAGRKKNRKAQVWISDYTMSLLLFIIALIIAVKIIINNFGANTAFIDLKADAAKISDTLLSEGFPADWTNESVLRPGILTGERLNSTKVYNAMNMSYTTLGPKFQTRYDFIVIFQDKNDDMIEFNDSSDSDSKCVIGSPEVSINSVGSAPNLDCHNLELDSIDYDDLVTLTRLVVYDSTIVKMVVYAWNE